MKRGIQAAFFCNGIPWIGRDGREGIDYVYAGGRRQQVGEMTSLHPVVITGDNFDAEAARLKDLEVIFSTWGMPALSDEQLDRLPRLRALFYAAGAVKPFALPYLDRNVTVVSAWAANAVSVAEFCLGQILLSCKGYFRNTHDCRSHEIRQQKRPFFGPGAYGETVAIIGAGQIGRNLIHLLKPFQLRIVVVDPYLSESEAEGLGVVRVTLEEAFAQSVVVSNHLPDLPDLARVLDGRLFASMRSNATFINTGRGRQVNEPELIAVLRERYDLMALLDVTDPAPCAPDSELYRLPNVQLSSHMAGAHDDEVIRMADTVIEEFTRWQNGDPLRFAVTREQLARMA